MEWILYVLLALAVAGDILLAVILAKVLQKNNETQQKIDTADDFVRAMTPVLQSVEAVVGQACQICRLLAEHAENAAFLMNTHFRPPREAAINPRNRGWGLLGRLLNSGWY